MKHLFSFILCVCVFFFLIFLLYRSFQTISNVFDHFSSLSMYLLRIRKNTRTTHTIIHKIYRKNLKILSDDERTKQRRRCRERERKREHSGMERIKNKATTTQRTYTHFTIILVCVCIINIIAQHFNFFLDLFFFHFPSFLFCLLKLVHNHIPMLFDVALIIKFTFWNLFYSCYFFFLYHSVFRLVGSFHVACVLLGSRV